MTEKPHTTQTPAPQGTDSIIESGLQHVAAAAMAEAGLQTSLSDAREGWMDKVRPRNGERTLSTNELTSLSALILYVAHTVGTSEFRIERDLADRFNVANVKCLPAANFDAAIRYLVDRVG